MTLEKLTLDASEIRFTDETTGTFEGYAAIFGEANDWGEVVAKGAFQKTLKERTPQMFWNHSSDDPIGTWTALAEDEKGLKVKGRLVTETRRGSEALALLKAGAVSGLSIGFRSRADKRGANGNRILTDVELVEVSVVSLPASSSARIHAVRDTRQEDIHKFTEAVRSVTAQLRG